MLIFPHGSFFSFSNTDPLVLISSAKHPPVSHQPALQRARWHRLSERMLWMMICKRDLIVSGVSGGSCILLVSCYDMSRVLHWRFCETVLSFFLFFFLFIIVIAFFTDRRRMRLCHSYTMSGCLLHRLKLGTQIASPWSADLCEKGKKNT